MSSVSGLCKGLRRFRRIEGEDFDRVAAQEFMEPFNSRR